MKKLCALIALLFTASLLTLSVLHATEVYKYRLYCNDEEASVYVWSEEEPATCPNDGAHEIDVTKTAIVEVKGDATDVRVVEQKLATTTDRLKWKGYMFTANANDVTTYDFTMPYDAHIQGGYFYAGSSKDGDMIEMIVLPGTPYEYKYIETMYIVQGGQYQIKEEFSMSALLPQGTPLSVEYTNTDSQGKIITFVLIIQIPEE